MFQVSLFTEMVGNSLGPCRHLLLKINRFLRQWAFFSECDEFPTEKKKKEGGRRRAVLAEILKKTKAIISGSREGVRFVSLGLGGTKALQPSLSFKNLSSSLGSDCFPARH